MGYLRVVITVTVVLIVAAGAAFVAAGQIDTEDRAAPDINPGYIETTLTTIHRAASEADIPLFLWYPATDPSTAPNLIAQNALFYGFHAIPDAKAAPGPHPVILLSHGSGGNAPQLGWLARDLAMRGFIVLGVNHPGTTSGDSDPHRTPDFWDRTADLTTALDWLLETPPNGLIPDPNNVAAMGFSLGGHTALALTGVEVSKPAFLSYCEEFSDKYDCGWMNAAGVDFTAIDADKYEANYRDVRISATVAIDTALPRAMTPDSLAQVDTRLLLVSLGALRENPAATNVQPIFDQIPLAVLHETKNSWHFSFLAECSTLGRIIIGIVESENICDDPFLRKRSDVHEELRSVIAEFLTSTLSQ